MVLRRGVEDSSETCLTEAESLDTWVIPRRRLRLPLQSVAWIFLWYGTDVPRDFWEEQVCSMRTGVSGQMGDSRPESPDPPKSTAPACSLMWNGSCPELWGGTLVFHSVRSIRPLGDSRPESPPHPKFTTHAFCLMWDGTCPEIWDGTFVLGKVAEIPVLSRAESPAQPKSNPAK